MPDELDLARFKIELHGLCDFAVLGTIGGDWWYYYDTGLSAAEAVALMYKLEWRAEYYV